MMGIGRRFVLGTLVVVLLAGGVGAQSSRSRRVETKPANAATGPKVAAAPVAFAALPFAPGETLSYNIDWNNYVAAARLELAVSRRGRFFGQEALHLTADVRTVGLVRSFLAAVDSHSDSYVDPKTVLPFRAERENSVNGKSTKHLITFDRARNTAKSGEQSVPIGVETGDALGVLYRLRAMRLEVGDEITLDGVEGSKRLEFKARVEGREDVTAPAGTFDALRVSCVPIENGQANEAGRFDMWFSDDAARLPVMIVAQSKFGAVRVALTKTVGGNQGAGVGAGSSNTAHRSNLSEAHPTPAP
jgi:hypothetical protein